MIFLTIRHGETDYNKEGRAMGSAIDAPLNETGIKQAHELERKLEAYRPTAFYSSPLLRTKQTAEIINRYFNLPIAYRDELKERDVGTLAGIRFSDIKKQHGIDPFGLEYDFRPFGGESSDDVRKRIRSFLGYMRERHTGKETLLIVTHSEIIRLMYVFFQVEARDICNACIHNFKDMQTLIRNDFGTEKAV
ncbi:MAG: histidine phosphatase family protein [Candidatus Paceibacteria bacterium]